MMCFWISSFLVGKEIYHRVENKLIKTSRIIMKVYAFSSILAVFEHDIKENEDFL